MGVLAVLGCLWTVEELEDDMQYAGIQFFSFFCTHTQKNIFVGAPLSLAVKWGRL